MKMVKSLLLGSAAGLVAIAGAQAADLPVKAKPVQYVKICSLYGVGFYYIPGTDTCIKVGGFVRAEMNFNANGSFAPFTADSYTRATNYELTRVRGLVSFDVRTQTEYGALRSYARAAWQWTTGDYQIGGSQGSSNTTTSTWTGTPLGSSSTTYLDRAFIQWAGFTFGKTQSFFDIFNAGLFSNMTPWLWMDTGGSGTPVFSYTAMFGNGLSGTLGLEDYTEQALPVVPVSAGFTNSTLRTSTDIGNNRGNWVPDIVGNLRVDQAWGFAQISAAAHQDAAQYYPTNFANSTLTGIGAFSYPANTTLHPGDAWGWAIGAGIQLNVPTGVGDVVSFAGNYCHGASRYCSNPAGGVRGSGALYNERNGHTFGFGNLSDAYYEPGGNLQLPNAWNFEAGFAHHWDAKWQTSLYGGYLKYEANSNAVDVNFCQDSVAHLGSSGGITGITTNGMSATGCRDWSAWQVGSRTLWNPVPNLDISVDIIYHRINSALKGAVFTSSAAGIPSGPLTYGDVSEWSGVLRFQRNFWP
jgi:hypothetical protein